MKGTYCQFCGGDLTVVEGLLGPQLFCASCRRFQPAAEGRSERTARQLSEKNDVEKAGNLGRSLPSG